MDYQSAGQIRDDDLYKDLVGGFKAGVFVTFVMDCCHSGSVLDLPFQFQADGVQTEMTMRKSNRRVYSFQGVFVAHLHHLFFLAADFDFGPLMNLASQLAADGKIDAADIQKLMSVCGGCTVL